MRPYRGRDGKPQLWFKPGEIDDWMEAELHRAGLYPTRDRPAVDVESFVDRHSRVALEQYADLEPHVLGETRFEAGRRPPPGQGGPQREGEGPELDGDDEGPDTEPADAGADGDRRPRLGRRRADWAAAPESGDPGQPEGPVVDRARSGADRG